MTFYNLEIDKDGKTSISPFWELKGLSNIVK